MRTFRKILIEWWPVLVLMLIAGALRFYELGAWPPGLYHDEAYNGLDALRVLAGDHPLYFAANNGREPFFIYLVSLSVGWLGRSVYAERFPAAVIGTLLIPATYFMARELFRRRVGLITAAITTITLWPIQLSLIGLRAGSLPLFIALSIGLGVQAYRSRRAWQWIITGIVYGLSFYTYLASRFTPLALGLILLIVLIAQRNKRQWRNLIIFAITILIVATPLIITALTQWEVVMGRPGEVSIFNPAINHGDPIGTLVRSMAAAVGMFFWRGDGIARHNVPYRPVFDPILAIFFAWGLIRLIVAALGPTPPPYKPLPDFLRPGSDMRFSPRLPPLSKLASLFVLIWIPVMLLPTILAEDSPHFLRAVGVLPIALIIPAIGLETLAQWLKVRGKRILSYGSVIAVLIVGAAWTIRDYSAYAVNPETAYMFENAGVQLTREARADRRAGRQVYVADRFARDWTSVPFLIGGGYIPIPDGTAPRLDATQPATLFLWPYEDWTQALSTLTAPVRLMVSAGPQAKGDLDPQPHVGYLAVRTEPIEGTNLPPRAAAQFDNGLRLLGYSIEAIDDTHWRLRTLWQTDRPMAGDQTFFVHLLKVNQVIESKDGDSGDGFYPLRLWKPGNVIVDERIIDVPPQAD
ncbi:MAG TPA: glycosyltransferase family 39 protein, partial [Anaerolineae bacterium]|nr:glycosyltransferase family 39 protein [Anaerolineae bacterium]